MIKELIQIANELDKKGLRKEANYLDAIIKQSHPRDLWGGRYRDQGYEDDRGGMDEGYHYRHCPSCGCKTEHESTPTGNVCISCDDKAREKLTRKRDKE